MTNDNEYSFINESGYFFDKYSCKEYDLVSEVVPMCPIYKTKKGGKYGIINAYFPKDIRTLNCIFDRIVFLRSNIFCCSDILKLEKNGKMSLVHGAGKYDDYKEYDYIYTPIQPLDKFIVCQQGKYGFIDSNSLKEIVEPTFHTIKELCEQYKCNIAKYTRDLYATDNKLKLESVSIPNSCFSHIIDKNRILKGKWGGDDELVSDYRTGEVYVYNLYYTNYSPHSYIPINMYGYFYNIFNCRVYNAVIHAIGDLYIVIKGKKFGLIDVEFNVLLKVNYKDIRKVKFSKLEDRPLFIVSCEEGQFLYNAATGVRTDLYTSIFCHDKKYRSGFFDNYLGYEENGKFGLLSPDGQIMVKAKFDLYEIDFAEQDQIKKGHIYFQEIFQGNKYAFYMEDHKFYGKVPIEDYEFCIRIGSERYPYYHITKSGGKYGLLNRYCKPINLPKVDELIFGRTTIFNPLFNLCKRRKNAPISETFFIGVINGKYNLYSISSVEEGAWSKLVISDCDEMEFIEENEHHAHLYNIYPYVHFKKDDMNGFVNADGNIISSDTFDDIKPVSVYGYSAFNYYTVWKSGKSGKIGLLDSRRNILLPCIYDEILKVTKLFAIVIENGIEKEIKYKLPNLDNDFWNNNHSWNEPRHYSKYRGSYAQEEMGYSDEDIDTIFEGDPDACWNID